MVNASVTSIVQRGVRIPKATQRRGGEPPPACHRLIFPAAMTDTPIQPNTAEMEAMEKRILAIQERRRDRIRWHLGKHTAEMAIAALADRHEYVASGKC